MVDIEWPILKAFIDAETIRFKYIIYSDRIEVYGVDGDFLSRTIMPVPSTNATEFTTSYQSLGNNLIGNYIRGNSTKALIGNSGDKLKVTDQDSQTILNIIANSLGGSTTSILKQNEANITSRNEFDLSGTTYTVPAGKKFLLTSFAASYDSQSMIYVRLKKQTGGTGAFVTQFRMTMLSGGQGESTLSYALGNGINIGNPGDVFKITIESTIAKGTIWAEFSGSEV